jgi:hypothetical protein
MAATRTDSMLSPGRSFDLPVWLPAAGSGPGLVLFQEIFERNWESGHDEADSRRRWE